MLRCEICNKEIVTSSYAFSVICSSECFEKHYWNTYVSQKDMPNMVRINGFHYVIEDENACTAYRGHGGRLFAIQFNDGRIVKTTNLWAQGEIPSEYKDVLTDNAVFLDA